MRLFVGIDIPDPVLEQAGRLLQRLKPLAPLRWSKPENLHITTRFIGEWDQARLEELKSTLCLVRHAPFPIRVRGLGWFPNPHSPRIFWIGADGGEPLASLASATSQAVETLGIEPENRSFRPHLTLARIDRGRGEHKTVQREAASIPEPDLGEFTAAGFHLYLSRTAPGGSVYTKLASFGLEG
jgi:2'-5' RNA ligase